MILDEKDYYDGGRAVSYNCPITIACGTRSYGKTYWYKRRAIRRFIKQGTTSVYMRRYDEQLKSLLRKKNSFISDLLARDEFPGWELRQNGRVIEGKRECDKVFKPVIYFTALSAYENEKSGHDAMTDSLIFDEFIKENKRVPYLDSEVAALMNFWETIDRREDRVRLYLLGNAADLVNPYFLEWRITITPETPRYTKWQNGGVLLDYVTPDGAFMDRAQASNIGLVTAGTGYDAYARLNQFADLNDDFIVKTKPSSATHTCTIAYMGDRFGVWLDAKQGEYYITLGAPSDNRPVYALTREDMRPNLVMLRRSEPMLKTLGRMYRYGYIWFDRVKTREAFLDVMRRSGQV